ETILILSQKKDSVRSVDVVNKLKYKKSSVSVAMKNLREEGLIEVDSDGHITLTPSGRSIAETILERHNFFSKWLIKLGVDESIALEDACRIEHVISPESFDAIREYVKNCNIKQVK
ncbi:MAG: metal-dependent transcriptional regulator, partial [Erysipelotrichaceae bacterium]|nr:metal-dependent transcriptional regulator [Erysipelotrichaceae bacterium]